MAFSDSGQEEISRQYVIRKLMNILDKTEELECTVIGANNIYGWYDLDWAERRKMWIKARALCFEVITQLKHVGTITLQGTNLQKYVDLSSKLDKLAEKIKNIMKSDDTKKNDHPRTYLMEETDSEEKAT